MKKIKKCKNNKILILVSLIIVFSLSFVIPSVNINNNAYFDNIDDKIETDTQNNDLRSQSLTIENDYTGIGAAWNLTHYANRTDTDLEVSFGNDSYDIVEIPLFTDWQGYKLNATIKDLYDQRNWNNGTFNYGNDDGTYEPNEDDTLDIDNQYQNWTFNSIDTGSADNPMSGNYYNSSATASGGHDCLELRMDGDPTVLSGYHSYTEGDKCWWNSSLNVPRGRVIDSALYFEVNPIHLAEFNSWELNISLNNIKIYSIGAYSLRQYGQNQWHNFTIRQGAWINTSNVYTNPINDSNVEIKFSFEYSSTTASYSTSGFDNIEYQQIFIDNIEIIIKAEVCPSQIGLKLNGTNDVNDINSEWGKGTRILEGNWGGAEVKANFSCNDTWALSDYTIDLKTDLNLFAVRSTPNTNYIESSVAEGVNFEVSNNSIVNWDCFGYVSVPVGYKETEMRLQFPIDVNITRVSEPVNPSANNLSLCDNSTQGFLTIPVNDFSDPPDGFWKFEAVSPNYCEQLNIFNNETGIWLQDDEFLSGDHINITGKITNNAIISGYIQQTKAYLNIRFPNGTIWTSKTQEKSPLADGTIYFDPFLIPSSPPAYEVGVYDAIISWNNSHSGYGLNETGVIYKKFTVIHNSTLIPDQNKYYYEEVFEDTTINLKVSFNDKENGDAIENAHVYLYNFTSEMLNFSEISPGFYLLEFSLIGANAGNNTLTIYANSSLYVNNKINITIEVIKATSLTVDESILSVQWNDNFTIQLNYTEEYGGTGIDTTPINDWAGESHVTKISQGVYNLTCNTSQHQVNQEYLLKIDVDAYKYEPQSAFVKILITERKTNYLVFINQSDITVNQSYELQVNESMNLIVKYADEASGAHIENATVEITGAISDNLTEYRAAQQYNINISASELTKGFNSLTILAQKKKYQSQPFGITILLIERRTDLELFINQSDITNNRTFVIQINETINIIVNYTDMDTGEFIDFATVEITGGGISDNLTEYSDHYKITISAENLTKGINFLTIIAQKKNYQFQAIDFRIDIIERETYFNLFLNQTPVTSYELKAGEYLNITLEYRDIETDEFLDLALVNIIGEGISKNLTKHPSLEQYSIVLDTLELGIGIKSLTLSAQKAKYQITSEIITIIIISRPTNTIIILNQTDKTIDKSIELAIGSDLNITFRYLDNETENHIKSALVQLIGTNILRNFTENSLLNQYSLEINSRDLGIGVFFLTILAQKTNFQSTSDVLRIKVNQIKTNVTTESGDEIINIQVGESYYLNIVLYDLDFGGMIKNATVRYSWLYGQGYLTDEDNDGTYTGLLENIPEGTFTITITVSSSNPDYIFEQKTITLNSYATEAEPIFLWLLIFAIGSIIALGSYFIAYQRVLKYPKPVRKTRKFKRTLKRKSAPSVEITSRDDAFKSLHKEGLGKVSKIKPGKPEDKLPSIDIKSEAKFAEETPSTETQPEDKSTEKNLVSDEKLKKKSDKSKDKTLNKSSKTDN